MFPLVRHIVSLHSTKRRASSNIDFIYIQHVLAKILKFPSQILTWPNAYWHLKTKHSLEPVQNIFINFLLVSLWPWKTSYVTKCSNRSLNLSTRKLPNDEKWNSPWFKFKFTKKTIAINLRVSHNCLMWTFWVKRKYIIRHIYLSLFRNFGVFFQDLHSDMNRYLEV